MNEKKCAKCGNIINKDLITYETKIWDEVITIPMIEGYKCRACGNIEVDEKVEERLKVKILEHKLEMYRSGKVKMLLINDIKNVRDSKGVAQGKIGEALDFTEQRFGAIERHDNTPTVYLAGVIAELLGVSIYDFYKFECVPMKVFLILENLDSNFNVIEGLPELRENYYKLLDEERDSRDKVNNLKKYRRRLRTKIKNKNNNIDSIEDNKEKIEFQNEIDKLNNEENTLDHDIEELDKKKSELQSELSIILNTIRKLEKKNKCILKQGYCLTSAEWEEVKKRYSDML